MSNFTMGTILGKGFPQAQVHTVCGTRAIICMHECLGAIHKLRLQEEGGKKILDYFKDVLY